MFDAELTIGALIRRPIRRYLLREHIEFIEDKGFLDSVFYIKCSIPQYQLLKRWIDEIGHE